MKEAFKCYVIFGNWPALVLKFTFLNCIMDLLDKY